MGTLPLILLSIDKQDMNGLQSKGWNAATLHQSCKADHYLKGFPFLMQIFPRNVDHLIFSLMSVQIRGASYYQKILINNKGK